MFSYEVLSRHILESAKISKSEFCRLVQYVQQYLKWLRWRTIFTLSRPIQLF